MASWRLQGKTGVSPCLCSTAEIDDVLHSECDSHLRGDRRSLADLAYEDGLVAKFLSGRVGEDGVEHDVSSARHVALVPFPVLADVDHLIAFVDQLLDVVNFQIAKRGLLVGHIHLYSSSSMASPASPYAPTFKTFSDKRAHLMRAGEMSIPSSPSTSALLIFLASSSGRPFRRSVSSDADACEIAHPRPWNLTSSITPSLTRKSIPITSPQRGLSSSWLMSGFSRRPKFRGFL